MASGHMFVFMCSKYCCVSSTRNNRALACPELGDHGLGGIICDCHMDRIWIYPTLMDKILIYYI